MQRHMAERRCRGLTARLGTFQHHPLLFFQAARRPSRPPPITTRATRSPVDIHICFVI
jgi:hypothetical protein